MLSVLAALKDCSGEDAIRWKQCCYCVHAIVAQSLITQFAVA